MLTKEQIDHAWVILSELFKQILYAVNIAPYKNIHDQAKQAINLATENERLKAKLAEIKAECDKAMLVKNPLKHAGCLLLFGDKLNNILAIIDKDGE